MSESSPVQHEEKQIGSAGRIARAGVGLLFIGLEVFWREPRWWDAPVGLVVMPALVLGAVVLWRERSRSRIRATGPLGHAVNLAVLIPLFLVPASAGAAFLFYGASMLVAAAGRSGGCEVTAISNALLQRDDQVGCPLFGPVDAAEASLRSGERGSAPC